MAFRKIKAGLVKGDVEQFVGEIGTLFFDTADGTLRLSDGTTLGGISVSGGSSGGSNYTLPTATTTVKGGVKIDGTTIAIDNQVISVGTVPYSNISGKPTAVSAFTNDSGYITSSSLSSYATQTYVTTRGYITSAGVPSAVSSFTNDSGYLTEDEFDLNTIDFDSNNNLHATGILPGDVDGFTAIFAGRAAGIAALPNTVIQSQAQVNDYAQNNFQNTFDGNHASTEWVATSPNGDDSNYYIDMGFTGAAWDGTASNSLYTNAGQRDGFLYVQGGNAGGGNLVLGTSLASTYTKIISGNASAGNTEVARFSSTEVKLNKQLTFSDNTTQTTAWTGAVSYNDLTDTPTLVTSYNDLTDLPTLITSYNELANLPSLFSGAYADLTGKPTLFSGSYNDLTNKPVTVQSLDDLSDVDLTTPPTIGQVLKYDGTKWAPGTDITAGGSGTDADTLDGFDSTYFLNYNNFTNKPTIPTTVTVNGTAITLGSSGTVTANTTNALTIGTGLKATASTFDGSTANTVTLDTTVTAIVATAGATTTLSAATLTPFYNITGTLSGTHIIRLPDLTTLPAGTKITFQTSVATIAYQLSTGTSIFSNTTATARQTTFTVISNAANTTANLSYTQLVSGLSGTGTSLATTSGAQFTSLFSSSIDTGGGGTAALFQSSATVNMLPSSNALSNTLNVSTAATAATYTKTLNLFTNLNGGTSTINIGTGVTSGTATINIASSTTTTTMNGAVTITSLTATNSIVGSVTGNAATATKLGTARAINGVNFDGSAAITITASTPNYLTFGSGLVGTTAQFDGSTAVTMAIDQTVALKANTTYVGTTSIALNRSSASQTLTGVSIDGNAATVTNGVYTTGTYANPAWITSLAYSKLTGTPTIFSGSYTDLTNKPSIPTNLSQLANDSGYITAAAIPAQFTFNVAADDSSLKTISSEETVKFVGANNITTSSDAEGNITITGPTLTSYVTLTGAQTVTNKTISGSSNTLSNIANSSLTNSSITVNGTSISLGSSATVTAAAGTLTGTTLNSSVVTSSLTSVGTLTGLTVNSTSSTAVSITADGRPGSDTNNWSFVSNQSIGGPRAWIQFPDSTLQTTAWTGTAAAGTLTGDTLNSTIVSSSLTSVGTLSALTVNDKVTFAANSSYIQDIPDDGDPQGLFINVNSNLTQFDTGGRTHFPNDLVIKYGGISFPDNTIQTTAFTGSSTVDANDLTGTTLASGVTASSLTSLGTLSGLTVGGTGGDLTMTGGAIVGVGNITASGILAVNASGGITTTQTSFDIVNSTATTVNIGGAATAVNIGATTGTLTLNNPTVVGTQTTQAVFDTIATTVTAFRAATTATIGATSGTLTLRNPTVVGTQTTVNLWNTTSTTVNAFGAATTLNIGAGTGTTTVNNNLSMASGKTIGTTGTITSNHTTAFVAGDNAISNIALQIPREGAIRNLYNGAANNMYFDVSIGGTSQGQFQFRSSSAYTNILTMSPTAFTVNTDAVVTARTASFGRLPWNSAIDTELTIDDYRWRITNSGGIYAQVISNTGGTKNSAWTAVAAISGQAVAQGGSTGVLLPNNSWTTLYTFGSMASAGDTVTVTFQDKNLGRIYRITFMRSDDGATTGYNIIGERLL